MTDESDPRSPSTGHPDDDGPPFGIDLIADLHAGVLPEDRAAQLWSRVRADPEGRRVLEALDATRDDLAAAPLPDESPPASVTAAIETTLRSIRADQARATEGRPDTESPSADIESPSADIESPSADIESPSADIESPSADIESLEDARDRRRDATRRRGLLVALAVAGVVAVVTLVIAVSTATQSSQGTVQNADGDATSVTRSPVETTPVGSAPPAAALLSVLGRSDATFDGSTPTAAGSGVSDRLRRCLAANGVEPSTPVVGSGPITVAGATRTVVLLSTGLAGRFDALVVGAGCDTGSPALISRTTIGAAPATR